MVNRNETEEEEIVLDNQEELQDDDLELEEEDELSKDKIRTLREKLKQAEAEKMKALEDLQRSRADFLNSKRRLEEQLQRDTERNIERVLIDFLPLLDSFDTALSHNTEAAAETETWRTGVLAMHGQFMGLLKRYAIEEIETLGKQFNPHEHEAISHAPATNEAPEDTIVAVLQKGFKRNDTIIRPAKVIVASN